MNTKNVVLFLPVLLAMSVISAPAIALVLTLPANDTPSVFSQSTNSHFNISCENDTVNTDPQNIHVNVTIEINMSGTFVNYSMSNATNGPFGYNFTFIMPANNNATIAWRVNCSNATFMNVSSWWYTNINKNTQNIMELNLTYDSNTYSNKNFSAQNITLYTDRTFTFRADAITTQSGTAVLTQEGATRSNPWTDSCTYGYHTITATTTGNNNYTANSTGFSAVYYCQIAGGGGVGTPGGGTTYTPPAQQVNQPAGQPQSITSGGNFVGNFVNMIANGIHGLIDAILGIFGLS